jgi:uncharacterized protein YprB with RNaseH-like and TPR domain
MDPASLPACAYLDIETSYQQLITVSGVYRPGRGTLQLVGPEASAVNLLDILEHVDILKTYNGDRFDLPVIKQRLGLDLKALYGHQDLMYRCWKHKLKGGLKSVERQLGICRVTAGVDGMEAMALWARWQHQADRPALDRLLHYNREDVELLAEVEQRLLERETHDV